jgi:hypothetical protein
MQTIPEIDPGGAEAQEQSVFDEAYAETLRQEEAANDKAKSVAASLGQHLLSEYERRKSERVEIEQRWLRDIRQYNGQYEPDFESFLRERKAACKVYVPLTRRIANIVEARLGDLLFPTDDRNFAVTSSPSPELDDAQEVLAKANPEQPVDMGGEAVLPTEVTTAIRDLIDEAKRKAFNMQRVVDDQLSEADWPTQARKVIHDAVKIGTGVVKGPFVLSKTKKRWKTIGGIAKLVLDNAVKPTIKRVDPWNFYPSLSAGDIESSESFFERHPMNKLEMLRLAEQPGFDREAIVRVLQAGGKQYRDTNVDAQRESAGNVGVEDNRFNVIEYNGPVDAEDLNNCGCELPDDEALVFDAIVWFSEYTGEVIKAIVSPMSAGNQLYSVYNWQPDSACIFGYGLPHEMRDLQESANSSFRAAHDNMALTVGPQVVVNSKKVTPMNGSWAIEPFKVWDLSDSSVPVGNVFGFYQIDSKLTELMSLFNMSKQLADEIGGPMMAMQGQDAPNYLQTATAMSIAYNSSNIWMRRAVKLWDDQVTVPRVRAFVDWNMEHNPDEDIKGDAHVLARGTSALLEAEGQVQRLQLLTKASQEAGVPVRKMILQLRQMAIAMRLDPDELLPSDDEIKQMEANASPPPNPEMERIRIRELEIQNNQEERASRERMASENNQIRMAEIASKEGLTLEQVRAKYSLDLMKQDREDRREQMKQDRENQRFNAELEAKSVYGSGI